MFGIQYKTAIRIKKKRVEINLKEIQRLEFSNMGSKVTVRGLDFGGSLQTSE